MSPICRGLRKVDYTYHYPAYTGLAVKKEENASDMVALKGTEVEVTVTGSQPLSGGRVVFADGKSVPLQPTGERSVMGKVTVDRTTTFRIELTNTSRQKYLDLEERSMEALDDQNRSSNSPSRDATRKRRKSKKSLPNCAPTMTSACASWNCIFR